MATRSSDGARARWFPTASVLHRLGLCVVAIILVVEIWYLAPHVRHYWQETKNVRWQWVGACLVATAVSMESFSQVQRTLLASAGVRVASWKCAAQIYASNSISSSLPAGQVLATTFAYRQARLWGASALISSWQIIMSGLIKGTGLALIGFCGALLAGIETTPYSLLFTVGGFLAFVLLVQFVASRPDQMNAFVATVFRTINRLRKRDPQAGVHRWHHLLEQLHSVRLSRLAGLKAFSWGMANWAGDIACLVFACYASDAHPSFAGLFTAYWLGKTAAVAIPLLPGGLGVVEVVLVPALTGSGVPVGAAFSAVVIYRLVSFLLVTIVGWLIYFLHFQKNNSLKASHSDPVGHDEGQDPAPLPKKASP